MYVNLHTQWENQGMHTCLQISSV